MPSFHIRNYKLDIYVCTVLKLLTSVIYLILLDIIIIIIEESYGFEINGRV